MTIRRSTLLVAGLAVSAALSGCGAFKNQRPLGAVDADAKTAMSLGDYSAAETDYREYIGRRPQSAIGHSGLGRALMGQGRFSAAANEFSIAMQMEPNNVEYFEQYCEALLQGEEYDTLFAALKKKASGSSNPEDYKRMARFAERAGTAEEALDALLTWARIDKGRSVEPQLALARFYRRVGDREKEMARLRNAIYVDPKNAEATARIRELGEIPGESFAAQPPEAGL